MDKNLKKFFFLFFILTYVFFAQTNAETRDVKEILEIIQKDLRTLERAVYSESFSTSSKSPSSENSVDKKKEVEDVLTRHLLKLSEIEKQFQELTNKYEEINFKMDKLSSRLSKMQADNQLRFQQLENNKTLESLDGSTVTAIPKSEKNKKKFCQVHHNHKNLEPYLIRI